MSNTVITNYSNVSGNTTESDKSLVIIVNKDGSVSLEKDTIKSLQDEKYENTSVSIVRMNEDGKPEDASDHSSDESVPHINLTVDAFFNTVPSKDFEKGVENEYISDLFGSEISLLGFQNDHCYTPLTSPSQSRRNSESENLPLKEDIELYPSPTQKHIPSSKKITVLESKVIAKGKGVSYFNTNSTCEVLKGTDILKRPVNTAASSVSQISPLVKKVTEPERFVYQKFVDESIAGSKKSYDRFSDNENAVDDPDSEDNSTLEDRNKSLLKRDVKKILSRKIELKNNGALNALDQGSASAQDRAKKLPKTYNRVSEDKTKISQLSKQDIIKKSEQVKQMLLVNPKTSVETESFKNAQKSDAKSDLQKQQRSVVKKDKKPPAHMTALFNDMSSLFASPDVIRRISTDSKTSSKYPDAQGVVYKMPTHTSPDKNIIDPLISPKGNSSKTYTNARLVAEDSNEILNRRLKDNINVLPDQLFPDSMLNPVSSSIDKMHINTTIGNNIMLSSVPLTAASMNAPLSPNLDLLSGLQPDEEGLTEDLLRHVAQLVESSENLQEVIDKQVLGKVSEITAKDPNKLPPMMKQIVPMSNPIHENEKTFINTSVLKKEPIQIMRSNGRIITLPPIEAPATRSSKRRSLLNTSVEQSVPSVSNADINKMMIQAQQSSPTIKPPTKNPQKASEQATPKSNLLSQIQGDKRDEDAESDESWNSEDDPDRLWCICKQPHNNRFMICCDLCEDWFHGKCVNITKAMGQEMEEKGIEWRCPNCLKKKALANAALKQSTPLRKSTETKSDSRSSDARSHRSSEMTTNLDSNTSCIVCKKLARASSIYCSDSCILKHAQESLIIASPPTNVNVKNLKDGPSKPKPETRVIVYERKTGKLLAGPNAPTASNLKVWLQEHPTYEVVRPSTASGSGDKQMAHMKPKSKPPPVKVQSVLQISQDKHIAIVPPGLKSPPPTNKAPVKQAIQITPPSLKSPPIKTQQQVKQPLKSPTTPKTPTPQPKPLKSPTAPTFYRRDDTPRRSSIEPIRDNVRKALQEQISLRMAESKDAKISQEDINKFSIDTEYELHDLFRDVGAKYKAKYRSLMFNLKDRKNLTLWEKICDRSMTPKQLVRLTPEELASQELAQWRDKEAKHQLELIKKSELDLLACNKTYVLKTHKGEEVMESRTMDTAELDPNVSVEDLVSELNKSVDTGENSLGSGSRPSSPVTQHPTTSIATSHDTHHSSSHHKHSRHRSRSYNRSRSHKSTKSNKSNHSSKDDKSTRKRSSSRDKKVDSRSHHRRSSRDKDKSDSKRDKSTRSRDDSTKRSSRSKNESDRKRSTSDDKRPSSSSTVKDEIKNSSKSTKSDLKPIKEDIKFESNIKLEDIKSPILFDDKSYMKNIDTSYKIERDIKSPYSDFLTSDISFNQKLLSGGESDQEPSSTVDTLNSAVWSGCVNMVDVAKFNVTAHEVSGQSDDVIYELDSDLDIVGRISPDTVWDYISKMKKQGSKDMLILKFTAISPEDKAQYMELYTYLHTRSRLGVIKVNNSGGIKDFYILPLPATATLHSVLLPLNGPGFGDNRTDLLIGILVKQRRKRHSALNPISAKHPKIARICASPAEGSYTPPRSPKRKSSKATLPGISLPSFMPNLPSGIIEKIAASLACADDDDEPYSPGGSDSRSQEASNSPSVRYDVSQSQTAASSELQRKMEELTRKIEEEKKQIENMAVNIPTDALDEPYSPSRPMSPPTKEPTIPLLSNIFLPSNLHEILASVKKNSTAPPVVEYVPSNISSTALPLNSPFSDSVSANDVDMRVLSQQPYQPTKVDTSNKGVSKLSTLSDAELLSMVPDDEILNSPNATTLFPPLPVAPPLPQTNVSVPPPPYKKARLEYNQPPPPGMDDDI